MLYASIGHLTGLSYEFARYKGQERRGLKGKKLSLGVFGVSSSATAAVYTSCPCRNGDGSIKTERKRTSLAPLNHWQKRSESVTCNRFPLRPVSPLFHVATISTRGPFFADRVERRHCFAGNRTCSNMPNRRSPSATRVILINSRFFDP